MRGGTLTKIKADQRTFESQEGAKEKDFDRSKDKSFFD
jgi:hypothetical protein